MALTCFMSFLLAGSVFLPRTRPAPAGLFLARNAFVARIPKEKCVRVNFKIIRSFACALALSWIASAGAEPYAYVPNEGSGTISIIDTATDATVGEIKTGGRPRGIAASPTLLYFSDLPSSALKVV